MLWSNSYYTLIASLPPLPVHVDVERMPITRERLGSRASMLEPGDRVIIQQLFDFLHWDRQSLERTDEDVIRQYNKVMATVQNPLAREIIDLTMNARTILAALRRRRRGLEPPRGVGRWVEYIRRHWQHPTFALDLHYPWIAEVDRLHAAGDTLAVQRILLESGWRYWKRRADEYFFSFEAVLLYVIRWEVLYRWVHRDADVGAQKFEALLLETLGDYANLY
jgi:hypothetical protein